MENITDLIRQNLTSGNIRFTLHAFEEMKNEEISPNEVIEVLLTGSLLENYPNHKRGACCLINGKTKSERQLHVVCTTANSITIIITVYEPKLPKFISPTQRINSL